MMKLFPSVLATSVLAVSLLGGCAMNPHHESAAAAGLKVSADSHNISSGTTTRVIANTVNVVGGSDIHWTVTPTVAKINPEERNGASALFTSNEQGTYTVKAWAKTADGQIVSDETNITVNGVDANGHPVTDNR
jgi:DNA/RNA endonuclease YhcR with UshA esterase domain